MLKGSNKIIGVMLKNYWKLLEKFNSFFPIAPFL